MTRKNKSSVSFSNVNTAQAANALAGLAKLGIDVSKLGLDPSTLAALKSGQGESVKTPGKPKFDEAAVRAEVEAEVRKAFPKADAATFAEIVAMRVENARLKASRPAGFDGRPTVRLGKNKDTGESTGTVQVTGILPMNHTLGLSPNNACRLAGALVEVFALTVQHFDTLTVKDGQDREAIRAKCVRIHNALQSVKAEIG